MTDVPGAKPPPAPRPVSILEDADRKLSEEPEVRDFAKLVEGDCWIVSRTIMGPIYIGAPQTQTVQLTDKPQSVKFTVDARTTPIARVLQPPNGTIKFHFQESDASLAFWKLNMGAKRIRNYLAFLAEIPIPLRHLILSKLLMYPFSHDQDLTRYHPEIRAAIQDPSRIGPWFKHVETAIAATSGLLARLPPDSPMGRAVSLAGGAVWADDPEDGFLSAWRAVDVVAKLDFAKSALPSNRHQVVTPAASPSGWTEAKKIRESLTRRVPGIDSNLISDFNKLRGKIAHDTVSAEDYRHLYQVRWAAFNIASDSVRSRLEDDGVGLPERGNPLLG